MLKILIIEDEPRAANQLQKTIDMCNIHYELLELIDSVEEAINWFENNTHPDLVFMDIQLGDGLCFEIFSQVSVTCPIIFTTAFDQYAIKAFKVNSVDYLLKPIKQQDVQIALNKYQQTQDHKSVLSANALLAFAKLIEKDKTRDGILVKDGSGFVQIKMHDIQYLYSSDSITFTWANGKRFIVDETLDRFLASASTTDFFRINRGQVVNKSFIVKIEPYFNHRLKLNIRNANDQEFIVSRNKAQDFKKWLNQ